jgi:chemotaxis methyl-accepting protein methylase
MNAESGSDLSEQCLQQASGGVYKHACERYMTDMYEAEQ